MNVDGSRVVEIARWDSTHLRWPELLLASVELGEAVDVDFSL